MHRIRLSVFFVVALLVIVRTAVPVTAQSDERAAFEAQLEALWLAGDYQEAITLIQPALERTPEDYDLLCRMAENLTDWARVSPKDDQEGRYEESVGYARRAVAADSSDAEGWFQLGKALGRLALFRGGKTKVEMSKEVKVDFEQALTLDPEHPGALHGLARWNREVANLSWLLKAAAKIIYGGLPPASNEAAITLFQKAIALEPENIVHYLEYGKTLLEVKERDQARAAFQKVLDLPAHRADDPEWKDEARQLLEKLR